MPSQTVINILGIIGGVVLAICQAPQVRACPAVPTAGASTMLRARCCFQRTGPAASARPLHFSMGPQTPACMISRAAAAGSPPRS